MATTRDNGSFGIGQGPSIAIAEAAQLFLGLRTVLNLSLEAAADLLATEPRVITALETGQIDALPPWPETQRLVSAYTGLAGCDPGPVLAILRAEIDRRHNDRHNALAGHASEIAPPAIFTRHNEPAPPKASEDVQPASPRWRKGRSGRPVPIGNALLAHEDDARPKLQYNVSPVGLVRVVARGLVAVASNRGARRGLVGALLAMTLIFALCQPGLVHLLSSRLPDPMSRGLRSVHDYLLIRLAPEREGLRWIEVDDPRARRTDKLHNAR